MPKTLHTIDNLPAVQMKPANKVFAMPDLITECVFPLFGVLKCYFGTCVGDFS